MHIVVAVKQVVDYRVKVRVAQDQLTLPTSNLKQSMNPFDAIAVEEAIRLKESGVATSITAVSISKGSNSQILKQCLAMGVCNATNITVSSDVRSSLKIAKILQAYCAKVSPDLVLLGKQAIDSDASQTGPMLAALLNWPQLTFVSKLELRNNICHVQREVDQGLESLAAELPVVMTVDLRLNKPRFPSLPNIIKVKNRPIEVLDASSLCDLNSAIPQVTSYEARSKQRSCKFFNSISDFSEVLRTHQEIL